MYEKLFSPVKIGRMELKNRVAMTSMGVNLAAAGGGVNDDIVAFYERRARGGVGLIVSGVCRVMDGAGASAEQSARTILAGVAENQRPVLGDTRVTSRVRGCASRPKPPREWTSTCWMRLAGAAKACGSCDRRTRGGPA